MTGRIVSALAATTLAVGMAAAAGPATAAPGTFTRITTPAGSSASFRYTAGVTNQFTVKGTASPDVTAVDIVCTSQPVGSARRAYSFATNVPVSSGKFTGTATYADSPPSTYGPGCRLRAVPTGTDPTLSGTYLGAFAGPVLHTDLLSVLTDAGATPYGFMATMGDGDGVLGSQDAGQCATLLLATVPTSTLTPGHLLSSCVPALPGRNLAGDGSAITVSGHNAYLPGTVHTYLNGVLALGVNQPTLTADMKIAAGGDVTITESAPLVRCSVDDTFPPTTVSCPSLVNAGIAFQRVSTFFRDGHQVRIRDTFSSSDGHAHPVKLQYAGRYSPAANGDLGFNYPGHGSQFHTAALGDVVTGLGSKAGTMLVRSDIHAGSDDADADTRGLTWSQAPAKIMFDAANRGVFAMPYTRTVHASGEAFIGFADSEGTFTSDVRTLGSAAVHDMVEQPAITSPHNGAKVHGKTTRVEGKVVAGANGLPTKVTVNGHKAHLGATSLVHGEWSVKFTESLGKHTLTMVATDSAGNTASRSIKVRNK